jgi:hypothetical protein
MYYKYFIEFLGTLTVLYAKLISDADPSVMGIVYFAMFTIGRGITHGYFSPLTVFVQYSIGRMSMEETMYNITVQYLAAIAIIITFVPIKTFIQNVL